VPESSAIPLPLPNTVRRERLHRSVPARFLDLRCAALTRWRFPRSRAAGRRRVRLTISLLMLAVVAVGYVVGMAWWQSAGERMVRFSDLLVPRAIDVLVVAWLFFIGASIGSFLNVVAWRMPRGMSIGGRSHCPRCANTLAWRDNVPVLGWIVLGGRCRYCRLPISPRYPIVEAAVGLCVLAVAARTFHNDAVNLPFFPKPYGRATALWVPSVSPRTVVVMVYHITAVAALWALALVRADGARIPRILAAWSLALVSIPVLVLPYLAIVPWEVSVGAAWTPEGDYLGAAIRVISAMAMAILLARMMARYLCPTADPKLNPLGSGTARLVDLILLLGTAAIVVGWQAVLAVTVAATLIGACIPARLAGSEDPLARFALGLPVAMSVQIAYWRWLHELPWWPSVNTAPLITLLWAAAIFVLPRVLVTAPHRTTTEPDHDPAAPD
jgi:leader peptidase (prepilin peptidase) / N-methyltransferase